MVIATSRDEQILDALAIRVRLLSLEQIACMWWEHESLVAAKNNATKRLTALVDAELMLKLSVVARPLPTIDSPVINWSPGEKTPDFDAAAWKLQHRWTESPRISTAYIATTKTAHLYGGAKRGALKQDYQATHDLGCAQVYLWYLRHHPELAAEWIGEDLRTRVTAKKKAPDAVLGERVSSTPKRTIEFGGSYSARRLAHFHRSFAASCYEIW